MMDRQVLTETWQPEGFVLKVERVAKPDWSFEAITDDADTAEVLNDIQQAVDASPEFMEMESAYTLADDYIGNVKDARFLCGEKGIQPEKAKPSHNVCSIGFSAADQKWYGWSHRAIYGFGIGSHVKKGDAGYSPRDMADFISSSVGFWSDPEHLDLAARETVDAQGRVCVEVSWTVGDVPNKKIVGERHSSLMYPPEVWGHGEWVAATLDDAKQMAIDFAESVG